MDDFRLMADAIEAEIRSGQLRAGSRLAPQREFANSRGIATSTAARVYRELERRGLVSGEIGRGTFVLGGVGAGASPAEGPGALVDLEANFPVLPEQPAMVAGAIAELLHPAALAAALQPVGAAGSPADRTSIAAGLARRSWRPDPGDVLFTGSGRQAVAAAIAALCSGTGRLAVEELTYPVVKSMAGRLGVTLVPVPMDEYGLVPAELAAIHRAAPVGAVYLQPSLHNPLGVTMTDGRRAEVAETLGALRLTAIEDGVNSFLRDDPPVVAIAPERTVYIDSFSKRFAAGMNLGLLVAPASLRDAMGGAIRSGAWTPTGFGLAAVTRLVDTGIAARIVELKRADAAARQRIVLERLAGFAVAADPAAYHSWWRLPPAWPAETFVSAAARHGIVLSPAAAFAVGPTQLRAVRLSNSSPSRPTLIRALDALAGLARRTPEDVGIDF